MIFILNKHEKVINFLKNGGENTNPFYDDLLVEDLVTGAETFSFSTIAEGSLAKDLVVGNFVAFKKDNKYKLFQIMQVTSVHEEELEISVYCECAGLSLTNKVYRARKIPSATFRKFLESVVEETDWNVGLVDARLTDTIDLDLEDSTAYSTLQNNLSNYGVEIEFRVEISNGNVSRKYIDVYVERGRKTGKIFSFGNDIEGITKTIDSTSLCTALIGRGKNGVTFKDVTVSGIDKPAGQDFVADQKAYELYNRNGYHLTGIFEFETESPEELLRETYKELQKVKEPKATYDVQVALLGHLLDRDWEKVGIGDYIGISDLSFNPPLMLMARVSKLETSFTNPQEDKCTLSNFVEVSSNITDSMRKIASQLEGYVEGKFPIGSDDIQEGAVNGSHMDNKYMSQLTVDIVKASLVETEKLVAGEIEAVYGNFEKIIAEEIEAVEGKFEKVESDIVEANKILAELGEIDTVISDKVVALEGNFDTINADLINVNKIVANLGEFDTVISNKVEAIEGDFDTLNADVAKIQTIISGNISSDNIQTGGITGDNLNMDTIFVNDANINSVSANKINSGEINTNRVTIQSENGGIVIADNTQQFKDKNNKVRVQIGQDATGEFSFGVFDSTGTGVLIDATGVKEKALADGIIKDRMINDGEINGSKIDIQSLITEVNEDDGSTLLKSSKVQLDTQGQTLDVAFNKLKTQADETKTKTESNTTALSVEQGRINTLIQDTTIEKDGQSLKLKDEYSKLEQKVGEFSSVIGKHSTSIEDLTNDLKETTGKITTVETNYSDLKQSLNEFKTTVGKTYSTKTELNSVSGDVATLKETVSTNESSIEQLKESIELKVEASEVSSIVNTEVNKIQIGGRNLIRETRNFTSDSSRKNGWWNESGRYTITESASDGCYVAHCSASGLTSNSIKSIYSSKAPCKTGETVTISVWVKVTDKNTWDYQYPYIFEVYDSTGTRVQFQDVNTTLANTNKPTVVSGQWFLLTSTHQITHANASVVGVRLTLFKNGEIFFKLAKIEKGNKATDWTPAPEDIESSIKNVITTTDEKITKAKADIKIETDKITQRVEKSETTITTAVKSISSQNLVIDGSFENNGYGWYGSGTIESKAGVDGGNCLKISANPNSSNPSHTHSDVIDVVPNQRYRLSTWYKTSANNNGTSDNQKVRLGLVDGTHLASLATATVTTEWKYVELVTRMPANVFKIKLTANTNTSAGYILFDNISLVNVEAEVLANQGITDAKTAQATAETAKNTATTANNNASTAITKLGEIASDSKLTANEKALTKKEWDIIANEKPKIEAEAVKFGVDKTNYVTRYNNLSTYLNPLLADLNATSTIIGADFRNIFTYYYNARQDVLNAITTKAKALADKGIADSKSAMDKAVAVDGKVDTVSKTVTETNKQVADMKITVNGINSSVSNLSSTVTKNTKVGSFRYIRDWLNGNTLNTGNHWCELEVWAGGTNIAKGKVPTGSSTITGGNLLTDGNTSHTPYVSMTTGWQWVQIDLGSIRTDIDSIRTFHYWNDGRAYNHRLEVSRDGSTWFTIYDSDKMGTYKETSEGRVYIINETYTETRLKTAEQKITKDAIINTVQSTINQAKNEAINSANSSTDTKLQSYTTKASMELTANQLKLDFKSSGGYNLIRNSTGYNATKLWSAPSGGTLGTGSNNNIGGATSVYMYLDNGTKTTESYAYSKRFKLKASTKYTLSGWFDNFTKCPNFDVFLLSSTSVGETDTGVSYTNAQNLIPSGNTNGNWKKYSVTFTTPANVISGVIRIDNNGYNASGTASNRIHWSSLMLNEGEEQPWTPHPSEIYDGNTIIDATGVTIGNGALTIKNKAGQIALQGDSNGNLYSQNGCFQILNDVGAVSFTAEGGVAFSDSRGGKYFSTQIQLMDGNTSNPYLHHRGVGATFTGHVSGYSKFSVLDMGIHCPQGYSLVTGVDNNGYGATWYGLGRMGTPINGVEGNGVILSGYYGLRFLTGNVSVDIPLSGDIDVRTGAFFNGWLRPRGEQGIYFQSYGGGWHMKDSTWIRAYGGKGVAMDGALSVGGNAYTNNNYILSSGGMHSWLLHRPNSGNTLTIARSYNWGAEDWDWEHSFDFNPSMSAGLGLHFGANGGHIKAILDNTQQLQVRNRYDTGYVTFGAYGFITVPSRMAEVRYTEKSFSSGHDVIDILKNNHIVDYSHPVVAQELTGRLDEVIHVDVEYQDNSSFLIEQMTEEAKELLVAPCGEDMGIDLNKMAQTLWKICQEQQNQIEELRDKVEQLQNK